MDNPSNLPTASSLHAPGKVGGPQLVQRQPSLLAEIMQAKVPSLLSLAMLAAFAIVVGTASVVAGQETLIAADLLYNGPTQHPQQRHTQVLGLQTVVDYIGPRVDADEQNPSTPPEPIDGETVIVTSPKKGDQWQLGQAYNITWTNGTGLSGATSAYISLEPVPPACLSASPPCLVKQIAPYVIAEAAPYTGSFRWTVPENLSDLYQGNNMQIMVMANNSDINGTSAAFTVTPKAMTTAHAPGTNIKTTDGTVFLITRDNQRRPYSSLAIFRSFGFNARNPIVEANSFDLALPIGDPIRPQDGKLFVDRGTVYLVTQGRKAGFASADVFRRLGYNFAQVVSADLSGIEATAIINDSSEWHRYGTLVNNHGTIQFIGEKGSYGIVSLAVFNSWGFDFKDVVPATVADTAWPQIGILPEHQPGQVMPF